MAKTTDIIVIGGGMAGIGAGARLSTASRVIVLEREEQPAYHTTGRSAAMFIENYGGAVVRQLTRASRAPLEDRNGYWPEAVLSPRGLLYLARSGEEKMLKELIDHSGGSVQSITPDECREKVPLIRPGAIAAGAFEEDAEEMDVNEILMGFRRMLKANGGGLDCRAEVTALQRKGGTWRIDAGDETYEAPVVVNAAGAWVDEIAGLAGLDPIGFTPCRRSVAIVPTAGADVASWPTSMVADESFYFKPEAGKLLVSPADETPVEPHDAYADDMALAEGIDAFSRVVDLEVKRVEHTWGGLRTFSPDRTHVIGYDPRTEGFFWFAGQGGYGIQSAHGGAMLVEGLIHHGEVPPSLKAEGLAAESVAPERFLGGTSSAA